MELYAETKLNVYWEQQECSICNDSNTIIEETLTQY